jgi:hypothetical protein
MRIQIFTMFGAATTLVLLAGALWPRGMTKAIAQVPTPSGTEVRKPGGKAEQLRQLVTELEVQADQQRALLRATEKNLERARAVLASLEQVPDGPQFPPFVSPVPDGPQFPPFGGPVPDDRGFRDQAIAEAMPWKWDEERSRPEGCARALGKPYSLEITPDKKAPWSLTLTLKRMGDPVYTWIGHSRSVFIVADDVLYQAVFLESTAGGEIVAFDLKANRQLWKTRLRAIPVYFHSMYKTRLYLERDDRHLIVYGAESAGRYVELLDLKTGETVGHHRFGPQALGKMQGR